MYFKITFSQLVDGVFVLERSAYDYGSNNMVCVFQSLVYLTFAALGGDHLAHMALVCTIV